VIYSVGFNLLVLVAITELGELAVVRSSIQGADSRS